MVSSATLADQPSTYEERLLIPTIGMDISSTSEWEDYEYRNQYEVRLGTEMVTLLTAAGELPAWVKAIVRNLNRASDLPENWDSYGAVPASQPVLRRALSVILDVMAERYPMPQVSATPSGGISFEWHRLGRDLEIEIDDGLSVEGYFSDEADESAEWERNLDDDKSSLCPYDLSPLRPYMEQLIHC